MKWIAKWIGLFVIVWGGVPLAFAYLVWLLPDWFHTLCGMWFGRAFAGMMFFVGACMVELIVLGMVFRAGPAMPYAPKRTPWPYWIAPAVAAAGLLWWCWDVIV